MTEKVKVCVMGQSFHWMNGIETLEEIKKHLSKDGGVAIIGIRTGIHIYNPAGWVETDPATARRNKAIYESVIKYLGIERRAGKDTFKTSYQPFTKMLDDAHFSEVLEQNYEETRRRSIEATLGYIYSTSWGNKSQLGEKANAFEDELSMRLSELKTNGVFDEKIIFNLLIAKGKYREP